jgi:hypothetical protein
VKPPKQEDIMQQAHLARTLTEAAVAMTASTRAIAMVTGVEIAVTLAGWLLLLAWALSGPRLGRTLRRGGTGPSPDSIPPAVVAFTAGLSAAGQFTVTLLDLAARGWFRLAGSERRAVCVLPAEAPVEDLNPYERTAVRHLARRAGSHGQAPADAVADGFEGGQGHFLSQFSTDVRAQARAYGLTRPTISRRRKVLLCLLALVPAAAPLLPLLSGHRADSGVTSICIFYYFGLVMAVAVVKSERLTSAGRDALAAWRAVPIPASQVTAAALGRDPAALAPFSPPGGNRAWSGYGEDWRLVRIGNPAPRVWPGMSAAAARLLFIISGPGVSVLMIAFALAVHDFRLGVLVGLALDVVVFVNATAPWLRLPTRAEFEGQVLRQWNFTAAGEDSIRYSIAIDDGVHEQAWALTVTGDDPSWLAPGTLVQVTVNPRLNKVITIQPFRRPASASHLLNTTPDPRAMS